MKTCSVKGCDRKYKSNGYCSRHYFQIYNHGMITSITKRTRLDPNEFIIVDDICWVLLYDNKCNEIARAKFDTKYYEYISDPRLKWYLTDTGYAVSDWCDEDGRHKIKLHEAIVQLSGQIIKDNQLIDHKDRDKLNCLDDNLRICEHQQNECNRVKNKNNTSGFKGVHWSKAANKWIAEIVVNYKNIYLGLFKIKEDAARAYNVAAIKYHGEFAVLNEV